MKRIAWILALAVCLLAGALLIFTVYHGMNATNTDYATAVLLFIIAAILLAYVFAVAVERIADK